MSDLFEAKPEKAETSPMVIDSRDDKLLAKVLDSGNIEVLKEYIALRNAQEERQARQRFEEEFSRMRAELPSIIKNKENKAFNSKYAPIEDLQRACDPVIFNHGFFYTWHEEAIPEGKRVIMDISGYGHTRSNYFDCPKIKGNNAQNEIQTAAIMSAYGHRYTFIAGFGIVIEGEDLDGNIEDGGTEEKLVQMFKDMSAQKSQKALMDVYIKHFKACANDKPGQAKLLAEKNRLIKELPE
jgi:hypothetical protein